MPAGGFLSRSIGWEFCASFCCEFVNIMNPVKGRSAIVVVSPPGLTNLLAPAPELKTHPHIWTGFDPGLEPLNHSRLQAKLLNTGAKKTCKPDFKNFSVLNEPGAENPHQNKAGALEMDRFFKWARNVPTNSEQIDKGPLITFSIANFVIVASTMTAAVLIPDINQMIGINLSTAVLSATAILGPYVLALPVTSLRSRLSIEGYRTICAIIEIGTVFSMQTGVVIAMARSLPAGAIFFSLWWILMAYSYGYTMRSTLSHPYQTAVTALVAIGAIAISPSKPHLAINIFSGISSVVISLWGGYVGVRNDRLQADLAERTRQLEEALIQRAVEHGFITEDTEIPFRKDSVTIRDGNSYRRIPYESIVFLSAHGMKTTVHTENGAFVASSMLGEIFTRLPTETFIRVHKSYAVKASRISRIQYFDDGRYTLFLNDEENTSLPVGRRFAPIVRTYMHLKPM